MTSATMTAAQLAEALGVSEWAVYAAVRRGEAPAGLVPLRVGRRLIWPRASVERLLGLEAPATGGS